MPAVDNPEPTGFAQFQSQLLLPGDTPPINLDDLLVFREASLTENVFTGHAEYTATYSSSTLAFVEKVLKVCELTGTPQIRFRYGYGQPGHMQWLPWQIGTVMQSTSMPINIGQDAGHAVVLRIGNIFFNIGRSTKTGIRKGFISDIVTQIAAENQLQAVIERTQNQFAYVQSHEDDITFISTRLVPRATNVNGRGNYVFYVRDNVMHFHTPDYQASYSELNYYQSPHMDMGQNSTGQLLFDNGVAGTRLIAYDPYTAQTRELASDPSKALTLAEVLPQFESVSGGSLTLLYHQGENRPEESVNIGQNIYERARMEAYKVTLKIQKVINIRAGNFINLVINPSTSQASTWSGVYLVLETVYVIKGGNIVGSITVTRGETASTIGQITAQAPNQELVAETKAPGHVLNLRDLQDSDKTKGAGQQSQSATTFASVLDPNSAPG